MDLFTLFSDPDSDIGMKVIRETFSAAFRAGMMNSALSGHSDELISRVIETNYLKWLRHLDSALQVMQKDITEDVYDEMTKEDE